MPTPPICAHRCAQVQGMVIDLSRAHGLPERVERLSRGLSAEYVPVSAHPCPTCTDVTTSEWAAAEHCDPCPTTPPED